MITTVLPEFTRQSMTLIDQTAKTRRPPDVADLVYLCTQCADWLERLRVDVQDRLELGMETKLLAAVLDEGLGATGYALEVMSRLRPLAAEPTTLDRSADRTRHVQDQFRAWKLQFVRPAPAINPSAYTHTDPPEAYVEAAAVLARLRTGQE